MNIRFNIEKSQRKALAQKIGELTGSEVKYLGVPSCGYQIGAYTLNKEAMLYGDALPDDIRSELQKAGYTAEDEPVALTISMPRDFFGEQGLENLLQIIENKETLLKHALNTESLAVNECEETVEFPWLRSRRTATAMPTPSSSPCFASLQRTCSVWSTSPMPATTRSTHSAAFSCASA